MNTGDELRGQAKKAGKLQDEKQQSDGERVIEGDTKRSEAPAIPYGNPPEASGDEPPEPPEVSAFA